MTAIEITDSDLEAMEPTDNPDEVSLYTRREPSAVRPLNSNSLWNFLERRNTTGIEIDIELDESRRPYWFPGESVHGVSPGLKY
jgi:hypothetical protein